ncbi:hypothetical protein I551_1642 [Mycobacterium ulcerans str. Harvey]|uniref:Uncharacterized protein n=1 Tax=Mycobacterium ulcerans str. Harvey TaxID=1299332 RepID=A0ABN0R427_MYCUL|nr:hypothetical protein I551_1642 [Mycobacterium ulcerans str. Harvey]
MWLAKLLAALGKRPARIALGYHQLGQAFDDDRQNQQVIRTYHVSNTSSEQNAGPIAIISPIEPAGGGSARLARNTSKMDTEERFPLLRSEFRV